MSLIHEPQSRLLEHGAGGSALWCIVKGVEAACAGTAANIPGAVENVLCKYATCGEILPAGQRNGSRQGYVRHLVHADPGGRFSVVALVWNAGQQTPVHGHYTWCAYRVLSGTLQEERYRWNAGARRPELRETVWRTAGDTGCGHAGFEQIHRLRNAGPDRSISLHVYGIDGERVATHVNRLTSPG